MNLGQITKYFGKSTCLKEYFTTLPKNPPIRNPPIRNPPIRNPQSPKLKAEELKAEEQPANCLVRNLFYLHDIYVKEENDPA
jgi:hypothetical protein